MWISLSARRTVTEVESLPAKVAQGPYPHDRDGTTPIFRKDQIHNCCLSLVFTGSSQDEKARDSGGLFFNK